MTACLLTAMIVVWDLTISLKEPSDCLKDVRCGTKKVRLDAQKMITGA